MTDTYIAFGNFYHMIGAKVAAFVGGLDCGDYVVDTNGNVNVPFASDSGGLCTAAYLVSLSPYNGEGSTVASFDPGSGTATYTIPVVIGSVYSTQIQALRPTLEAEIKSPEGSGIGKTRRLHNLGVLFVNTVLAYLGTDVAHARNTVFTQPDQNTALPATTMFNGIYWLPIDDDYSFDGQAMISLDRPGPLTVAAVTSFVETSER